MKRLVAQLGWLVFGGMLVLAGCGHGADDPGIAAMVNGVPITVADLEARHDLDRLGLPEVDIPPVAQLRSEYGAVLSDMIVARLADQELAKRHLDVTEAELDRAEAAVRTDYSKDAFEGMFREEHLDHKRWREALRDRLTVDKLVRDVLGAQAHASVSEVADYYKAHIDAFAVPAQLRFLLVQSPKTGALQAALGAYKASGERKALTDAADVVVEELTLPARNLPQAWQKALSTLKPGEASPILADQSGNVVLVLLDRMGETVPDPAKAYARAEAIVSAAKREQAFAAWLTNALGAATIKVHAALLPEKTEKEASRDAAVHTAPRADTPVTAPPSTAAVAKPEERQQAVQENAPPVPAPASPDAPVAVPQAGDAEKAVEPPATVANVPAAASPADRQEHGESVNVAAVAQPAQETATPPPRPVGQPAAEASTAPSEATPAGQEVEFQAVKASWLLYQTDEGEQQRVYLKPGKPLRIAFSRRLTVRPGSPSEVTYHYKGREKTVKVEKKESRVLEFP